jgi:hypothetical protein
MCIRVLIINVVVYYNKKKIDIFLFKTYINQSNIFIIKMQEYSFESKKSKNVFKLFQDKDNIVWLKECGIDDSKQEFIDELLRMVKIGFNAVEERGSRYFSQSVLKDELNFYKSDNRWKFIKDLPDGRCLVQCNIKDASECLIDQFLGKEEKIFSFESKESENMIKLIKDKENIVWIDKYHIDNSSYDYIKEFWEMIVDAFQDAKEKGGEFHSQYISKDIWDGILNTDDRWDVIEKKDDLIHIQCDIDDAAGCVIDAFTKEDDNIYI